MVWEQCEVGKDEGDTPAIAIDSGVADHAEQQMWWNRRQVMRLEAFTSKVDTAFVLANDPARSLLAASSELCKGSCRHGLSIERRNDWLTGRSARGFVILLLHEQGVQSVESQKELAP